MECISALHLRCASGELEWIQWGILLRVSGVRLVKDSNFDVSSILPSWRFCVRIPSRRVRFQLFPSMSLMLLPCPIVS